MLLVELTAAIDAAGTLKTFYFGDSGYVTSPTDTPANTPFLDRLLEPGVIGINAYSNGRTGGATKLETGEIAINNLDGEFDALRNYSFRTVVIRSGALGAAYPAGFVTVLNATAEGVEATWKRLTIRIRDKQYLFSTTYLTNRYLGTNVLPDGVEGVPTDIKGKVKPKLYGAAKNFEPPVVNTSKLVYQIHDGALTSISAVYDKGVALTPGADYATNALLIAAAPAASTFITCLAEGLIRLGSNPVGQITVDAAQGATSAARTVAQVLKALALGAGVPSGEISATDVVALDALNSGEIGLWVSDETSTQTLMDSVAASIGGWYGFDGTGVLRMGQLAAPTGSPVLSLQEYDIKDGLDLKPARDTAIPVWRAVVNYAKIYVVQTINELAGSVTAARRAQVQTEYRKEPSTDPAIKTQWLLADDVEISSLLNNQADAATESSRLLALFKVRRDVLDVPIDLSIFTQYNPNIMAVISVTHPRFGMGAGKLFKLLGYRIELAKNRVTLTLWG